MALSVFKTGRTRLKEKIKKSDVYEVMHSRYTLTK